MSTVSFNDDELETFQFDPTNPIFNGLDDLGGAGTNNNLEQHFKEKIHLRIRKRNAKKSITTVEGLADWEIEPKKLMSFAKKKLCCNGAVIKDKDGKEIVQLQGDQREEIVNILKIKHKLKGEDIVTHGF